MAVTKGSDSHLRRRGRAVRCRPHRDVPARRARPGRRRADVDPQPGRSDPVRHQRPGPRGRAGRDRLGVRAGPRLDRPVLPLDRDVPDVRDERARHHDRAVRDGQRPVVGRPPDARPLRQPRAQPRLGQLAGRDAAAPRGRHRAGGQDPQDRPGRDDHRWARARRTRATSTRASTSRRSTSCRSSSWSRTTATRSACRSRWRSRSRTSPTGRPATASRASSSTARTCSRATRRRATRSRGRARARARRSSRPR